ncbi:MAG: peptidoglycan editing factor PgeF [Candidatus Binataceae bacterium]
MQNPRETEFATECPPILQAWPEPTLVHGFLGRRGGQSVGVYESMNLSQFVGDNPADVDANWMRLRAMLPAGIVFARLNQVHGNAVRVVTRANAAERPPADGMATREAGIILGIFTADCVPVLMTSPKSKVTCALHAGWRGVIAGIAGEGVRAMERLGAPVLDIRAALGPSIGPCCFEVDASLAERFVSEIPAAATHARDGRPGKAYLDLRGIVRDQLVESGVPANAIESAGPCTRCASDHYFSRRAASGSTTGLQMSFAGFVGA